METIAPEVTTPKTIGFWERNKNVFKGLMIGILILLMLIPNAFVTGLIHERAQRQQTVTDEVSEKWSGSQLVTGPILVIPYMENMTVSGKIIPTKRNAYFLPDKLNVKAIVDPESRHRSLFDVTLYKSTVLMDGSFAEPDFAALQITSGQVLWQEAHLILNVSDTRGLEDEVAFKWNNAALPFKPGVPDNDVLNQGMSAAIVTAPGWKGTFNLEMRLKGSKKLDFLPIGKTTTAEVISTWKSPSFEGSYLPNDTQADKNGFHAHWKVIEVSRPFPQMWKNGKQPLSESAFGVMLLQPTSEYVQTERSSKYAILFIGLTFAIFFLMEIIQKKQIHPIQYVLVGLALIIFYTLLLSFSEYIGFAPSYWVAALATVLLIGWYVRNMFSSGKLAFLFTLALTALYGYIFFLIQLEDYALLFGSIGIFVILALLMYGTRKVDWYGHK